jgi:hypothetical protein
VLEIVVESPSNAGLMERRCDRLGNCALGLFPAVAGAV